MDRIERLEAQVKRLRLLLVSSFLLLLTLVVAGAARGPAAENIVARKIQIVDELGRVGITLESGNSQSQIAVNAPTDEGHPGRPFVRLHAWHNEEAKKNQAWFQMMNGVRSFEVEVKPDSTTAHATDAGGADIWSIK